MRNEFENNIDWRSFLVAHDPLWRRLPEQWFDAPFLGNGNVGTQVYRTDDRSIRICVQRGDYTDHRRDPSPGGDMLAFARLPLGYFTLETVGEILDCDLRLCLHEAELSGAINTTRGRIALNCLVHSLEPVLEFRWQGQEAERDCVLRWLPAEAVSPRWKCHMRSGQRSEAFERYALPPLPEVRTGGGRGVCRQTLLDGGDACVAWETLPDGNGRRLLACPMHSYPETASLELAEIALERAKAQDALAWRQAHYAWWHAYYRRSFVSLPDPFWEGFYWLQIYKYASATRADGMLLDNQGPWLQDTPWPGAWFNLNVQLSYWVLEPANRGELGESLYARLDRELPRLIANLPEELRRDGAALTTATGQNFESGPLKRDDVGMLAWIGHNYWLHCRHAADKARMCGPFFNLLDRAVGHYLRLLEPGADGRLHLSPLESPEFTVDIGHGRGVCRDANFHLALLKWGLATLLKINAEFNLRDPRGATWRDTLARLADYPCDDNGFMVGAEMPMSRAHRHFSHLMMVYPLKLLKGDDPGERELILRSLRHWLTVPNSLPWDDHAGYTYTSSSSIYATLGMGDEALEQLEKLKPFLSSVTMYKEAGPVIETPLSAAQSLHDMLLQSADGIITVFPALPSAWKDVCFLDLRTEGAFLVGAARVGGRAAWISVKSLAGERCVIKSDITPSAFLINGRPAVLPATARGGEWELALAAGDEALLIDQAVAEKADVRPVEPRGTGHRFGLV
jgi:alpha-L-fucosidase 2